jgi:hypothetical protein
MIVDGVDQRSIACHVKANVAKYRPSLEREPPARRGSFLEIDAVLGIENSPKPPLLTA